MKRGFKMKKMQCEVCGGTTIKKIGESMFECQSCGVQYGKEEVQKLLVEIEGTVEVTGTVKIDRSEEVDNAIKRAEQFYEKGDTEKAEEYYNKALDLDPDNAVANAKVDKIGLKEKEASIILLNQTISIEEGVKVFLDSLKLQKDIVADIYKEIEIISNKTSFYRMSLYRGDYKGQYTGTACYKREVPYTDYEEKRERLSDGTYVTKRVPVTKYRTEIDRAPASGFFENDVVRYYIMSDSLYQTLSSVKDSGIAEVANRTDGVTKLVEDYFECNFQKLINEFSDVKFSDLESTNGNAFYNGVKVDTTVAKEAQERADRMFNFQKYDSCCSLVEKYKIPGDFCEDVDLKFDQSNFTLINFFVPIQVIEYAYRGEFYIAILILNEKANAISMTYPLYKSLDVAEKEDETKELISKKKDLSSIVLLSFFAVVASIFVAFFAIMFMGESAIVIPPVVLVMCVVYLIYSAINNSKLNKQIKDSTDERNNKLSSINSLHGKVLLETSTAFFKEYENTHSMESARNAAITANDFSVNIEEVFASGSNFSNADIANADISNNKSIVEQTNTNSYLSNHNLTYTLKSIGDNKIQVIAALREALDIGLAEAKEIADSVPTNITYKDLATANRGNQKLTDCGCGVETED